MHRFVDVLGFAGGFTLGMVQAGFELAGKREMKGGFGVPNCEANRHLLGHSWKSEVGDHRDWSPVAAEVVAGNPPCSGFSVMSAKEFRGAQSKINDCMWAFADYVIKVKPQIAVFESVQQARTRPDGLELMRQLRAHVEAQTGMEWTLHHVRHNAYSIGGLAQRRRYFWVISRIPFGVEKTVPERLPTLMDGIGDLSSLQNTWKPQSYSQQPSWWAAPRRRSDALVDGHRWIDNPLTQRLRALLEGVPWNEGEHVAMVARRYYDTHGRLPESWEHLTEKLVRNDFFMGFTTPVRWRGNEAARVITGGGLIMVVHPTLPRTLTHRETARILGFPDDWLIEPLAGNPGLSMTWGKGITVDCGKWIGDWIHAALDENPGTYAGELIGDREYDIDCTNAWRGSWYSPTSKQGNLTRRTKMTEVAEGAEGTETKRSGRPRPGVTQVRDVATFALLEEPKTRNEVAEAGGLTIAEAYLSLHRLRKDGKVEQFRADGKSQWRRVEGAEAPAAPEPAAEAEAPAEAVAA